MMNKKVWWKSKTVHGLGLLAAGWLVSNLAPSIAELTTIDAESIVMAGNTMIATGLAYAGFGRARADKPLGL